MTAAGVIVSVIVFSSYRGDSRAVCSQVEYVLEVFPGRVDPPGVRRGNLFYCQYVIAG